MKMMMLAITQVNTQHRDVPAKVFRNIRSPKLLCLTWEQPVSPLDKDIRKCLYSQKI